MPDRLPRVPSPADDPWFIETVMYHGRTSRRPVLRGLLGLAFGLLIAGAGVFMYADLAAWEAAGRPARSISAFVLLLYEVGGKNFASGVAVAAGLWFVGLAARGFAADRRAAARQTDARPEND